MIAFCDTHTGQQRPFKDVFLNSIKQQVDMMLYTSERLLKAYSLKELFFEFMQSKDSLEAKKLLSQWILYADNSQIPSFVSCAKTMSNWSVGILNSFDCTYTNGFTEEVNNKIKVIKRNAYGYRNFERFRKRILHIFNNQPQKITQTS